MIELFQVQLDEAGKGWEDYVRLLPSEEQARARRFHHDADRLRFAKCRALLRRELGQRLQCDPQDLEIRLGEHGKPFVAGDTDLHFNLSHTRGAALLAFARKVEIGVDIENAERRTDLDGVAQRVFTERELAELGAGDEAAKRRYFFALWTAKEAFLKAIGSGLSLDPSLIEARMKGDGTISYECESTPAGLSGQRIDLPAPYSAAICAPDSLLASPPTLLPLC